MWEQPRLPIASSGCVVRRMFCALCRLLLSLPGCKLLEKKSACMLARARSANACWTFRAQPICKLLGLKDFSDVFSRSGSA